MIGDAKSARVSPAIKTCSKCKKSTIALKDGVCVHCYRKLGSYERAEELTLEEYVRRNYPIEARVKWKYGTGVIAGAPYRFHAGGDQCWRVPIRVDQTGELVVFSLGEFRVVEDEVAKREGWQ